MAAPALSANGTPYDAGASVAAAGFLGEIPAFALDNGNVLFLKPDGSVRVAVHPGASILVSATTGKQFITGGDDGRVAAVSEDGAIQEIADEKGKWIDSLATRDNGAIAWSSGKNVRARDPSGNIKTILAPSSVRGLAFLPKGYRIAFSHYDGASLWFPNAATPQNRSNGKGRISP